MMLSASTLISNRTRRIPYKTNPTWRMKWNWAKWDEKNQKALWKLFRNFETFEKLNQSRKVATISYSLSLSDSSLSFSDLHKCVYFRMIHYACRKYILERNAVILYMVYRRYCFEYWNKFWTILMFLVWITHFVMHKVFERQYIWKLWSFRLYANELSISIMDVKGQKVFGKDKLMPLTVVMVLVIIIIIIIEGMRITHTHTHTQGTKYIFCDTKKKWKIELISNAPFIKP